MVFGILPGPFPPALATVPEQRFCRDVHISSMLFQYIFGFYKRKSRSRKRNGLPAPASGKKLSLVASINPVVMHLHLMALAMVMIICGVRRSDCAKRRYRDCQCESDLLHNVFHRLSSEVAVCPSKLTDSKL
jgi:hypothetical protein